MEAFEDNSPLALQDNSEAPPLRSEAHARREAVAGAEQETTVTSRRPLSIDPDLKALCPTLDADERQQLEQNLCDEGCREPLVVWREEHFILDGHHRFDICNKHGIPYKVQYLSLPSREAATNWIINNQLGRRNLTPEQKSYLQGKRYNLEKKREGRPEKLTDNQEVSGTTHERLAKEYGVAPSTIRADGQFAEAVDTLEAQVGQGIRDTVLQRQPTGDAKVTKKHVTQAGKLLRKGIVKPFPCMRHAAWKAHQVVKALEMLGEFPQDEYEALKAFFDGCSIAGEEGVRILRHLKRHTPEERQRVYTLAHSEDPVERSLAKTLAAKQPPEPAPQSIFANDLIHRLERTRRVCLTSWREQYPHEPWSAELAEMDQALAAIQDQGRSISQRVEAAHQQRIAHHVEAFQS